MATLRDYPERQSRLSKEVHMGVDEAEARLILALRGASQDVKLTVLEAALSQMVTL